MKIKGIIAAILICFTLAFTSTITGAAKEQANEKDCCNVSHQKEWLDTHLHMYFYLLAEKFAPDQVQVWEEIKQERDVLEKKLEELHKAGALMNGNKVDHGWQKEHAAIQVELTKAVKTFDQDTLKEIIPKMFAHQKKLNEIYKKNINMAN